MHSSSKDLVLLWYSNWQRLTKAVLEVARQITGRKEETTSLTEDKGQTGAIRSARSKHELTTGAKADDFFLRFDALVFFFSWCSPAP